MRRVVWAVVWVAVVVLGCGESRVAEEDAGEDSFDARVEPGDDAQVSDHDAQAPSDRDAQVIDAGAPEECDTPGAVEAVPCGNCGVVSRFCTAARVWEYAECQDEGECAPGSFGTTSCGSCGTQTTRCTVACTWEPTGACSGEGECAPGTRSRTSAGCTPPATREVLCNDACTFEPVGACAADACPTPGETVTASCGRCGTRERFCTAARVWEDGPCEDEGVCMPGTTGPVACGRCGTRTARCTTACEWDGSGTCTGEGVCEPGTITRSGASCPPMQTQRVECTDACTYAPLDACRASVAVDVMLLLDMTGSIGETVRAQVPVFGTSLVGPLLAMDDVAVGVASFADFPVGSYGAPTDRPFEGGVQPTRIRGQVDAALGALPTRSGVDAPESAVEALSVLSGGTPPPSAVPLTCSGGRTPGGCWRSGAQRVIVLYTDAPSHNGPDASGTGLSDVYVGIPGAATWPDVRTRLMADGTILLVLHRGVTSATAQQYERMLQDLGQPPSDRILADSITPALATVVARIQAIAMP